MAAYAPLFCKKGFSKWGSNLIWFDNRGLWRTTNYYYMSMFASNIGNKAIGISPFYKTADQSEDTKVYTSPTIDTKTGTIYLKAVNAEALAKETIIALNGTGNWKYKATMEYLTSEDTAVKNQGNQNYYSSAPDVKNFSYHETITPQTKDLGIVSGSLKVTLPVNSVCVIKLVKVK